MLRVNEIFPTIQGEAFWTGTPSTFIRLQGCPVACPWCDTKHTWSTGSPNKQISVPEMLEKVDPAPTWAQLTHNEIVQISTNLTPRHFVITGGEPCAQNILPLTSELQSLGSVQIETSGTHNIDVHPDTWVTVSPKINMPGNLPLLLDALDRANEIKMPIQDQNDLDNLLSLLQTLNSTPTVWLQPVSQNEESTKLCMDACLQHQWKLSLQTHKYAGVR